MAAIGISSAAAPVCADEVRFVTATIGLYGPISPTNRQQMIKKA